VRCWNDEDSRRQTDEKKNQQSCSDREKPLTSGSEILAARDTEQEKIGQGLARADDQRDTGYMFVDI
jgi:hypothetical protein